MATSLPSAARLVSLAAITQRQHGLFTMRQANHAGLSRGMVDHKLRTGELVAVDERVYRSVLTPPSWHQRLLAACLAGPAVASHRAAAVVWRAPTPDTGVLEVTALRHRRRKSSDVVWHESYLLDEDQVTEIDGIPVTVPTRTIVDLGAVFTPDELIRVLDDFTRRRLTTPARVASELERLGPRRPGRQCVEETLTRRFGPGQATVPESDLETVFESLLRRAGLPQPERQVAVPLPNGRVARIDFAYRDHKLGIEVAGAEFHATPERWANDVGRLGVLAALGWMVLVFSDDQVRRTPDIVIDAVRHALARCSGI